MTIHESRYYQLEAKEASIKALLRNVTTQMIVAATGTGKSKIGVDIAKDYSKVLWLTHNIELIEQSSINLLSEELGLDKEYLENEVASRNGLMAIFRTKKDDAFTLMIKANIGIIKEELQITDKRITIASIQTIWRRLDSIPENTFDLIIVDECHHAGAPTWKMVLEYFKTKLRLGLTATPWRSEDDLSLDYLFEEIVYEYSIQRGIKDGFLCKPKAIRVKTSANLDTVHTRGGDFNQNELREKINTPQRNYLIVDKYIEHAKGRPFIAFCVDVQHTVDLCEAFNEKGVKANFVVGDKLLTPDRQAIIRAFKAQGYTKEEAEGLINCMIATEGFDFANIGCVILACPTKSKTKFYQMLGRGLRLKDVYFVSLFGQNCVILDIVDNTTKHRTITCDSEDALLPVEARIFLSDEHRQKLIDAKEKRERMIEVQNREQDEIFELFPIPKVPRFKRSDKPATEPQLKLIKHLGYDVENEFYTYNMIQDILLSQPASKQDFDNITSAGYDTSRGLSIVEAKLAYSDLIERDKRKKLKK